MHENHDEKTINQLEDLQRRDNIEKYVDIVEYSTAAANAQRLFVDDRPYRSHDEEDTLGPSFMKEPADALDEYGLRAKWDIPDEDKKENKFFDV